MKIYMKERGLTTLGVFAFFVLSFGTRYVAIFISKRLFLINKYGIDRYNFESLEFINTPKESSWLVSNGDLFEHGIGHFFITSVIWILLFFLFFIITYKIFGRHHFFLQSSNKV